MHTDRRILQTVLFSTALALGAGSASAQIPLYKCSKLTVADAGKSFILTEPVASSASQKCFEILGNDITLDLNGHAVTGLGASVVAIDVLADGVTIRNGAIRDVAIAVDLTSSSNATVENLKISNTASWAIGGAGGPDGTVIRNNQIVGAKTPISVGSECTITGNTIRGGNTTSAIAFAINTSRDCLIRGNTIFDNAGMGGIKAPESAIIENVIARNGGPGIDGGYNPNQSTLKSRTLILNNIVRANSGSGIAVNCPALLIGNVVLNNQLLTSGTGCKVVDSLP